MEEQIQEADTIDFQEKPSRLRWIPWLALGGFVILICAVGFIGALILAKPDVLGQYIGGSILPSEDRVRHNTRSNTMGDPGAPVHIIEYVDFQCLYCLKFWQEVEPEIIEQYVNTGTVYFEYRAYPVIGPESKWAAEGVYCAGDQEKFWEFYDTLFTNWTGENTGDYTREKLIQYAESIKLDLESFRNCLDDEKHKQTVEQDEASAEADGVHATPTFIINGTKVEGMLPFNEFEQIIEQILLGDFNTDTG